MAALQRFFLSMLSLLLSFCLGLVTMIFGWGLEPKSWGVIIGVGVFGQIFALTISAISVHKS
jgi:hypothetical protein